MAPTPSHRLKLQRAEQHLASLDALVAGLRGRRPYPVSETFDPKRQKWIYHLRLDGIEPPEMFPIVLGDVLFNMRSALDHLVVAIAPKDFKKRVGFPICTVDPLATDERTGKYLDAQASGAWISRTKGLPADCVAAIRRLQPYEAGRQLSEPAEGHPLAILSALQNADKHRNLVGVISALKDPTLSTDGKAWDVDLSPTINPALKNGAEIYSASQQVKVEIEGAATIGVGRPNEPWDCYEFIAALHATIANCVLPWLEPFLPGGAQHQTEPPTG